MVLLHVSSYGLGLRGMLLVYSEIRTGKWDGAGAEEQVRIFKALVHVMMHCGFGVQVCLKSQRVGVAILKSL